MRRKGLAKTSRAAQLENLEHKIEHLVNALANSQAQKGYADPRPTSPPTVPLHDRERDRIGQNIVNSLCIEPQLPDPPNSGPTLSPNTSTCFPSTASELTTPAALVSPLLSATETEMLLNRYRTLMAGNMPFVVLPPSNAELESKPVLLQAVLTVAVSPLYLDSVKRNSLTHPFPQHFHDYPKQHVLVKQLIRDISERTLINGEKSLDIVQAILVLVAWFYSHIWSTPQMSNLLHLAQAMIGDLNLDRSPQPCPSGKHGVAKPGHPPPRLHATLEEHRTVAGVVFFVNMLFSNFKKITPVRRFKYFTEILDALQQAREYPSDLLLVQLVRLQFLADDSCLVDTPNAPVDIYMKAFQNDLQQLRLQFDPCVDQTDIFLRLQYLSVEICILEMSLNDVLEGRASVSAHLDNLWRCFDACKKSFTDVFFTIPASTYLALPFHHFAAFAHSFIVLIKLATLEGWSTPEKLGQISYIIEETASRYESSAACGPEGVPLNNDSLSRWAARVRMMRQVYEGAEGPDATPALQQPTPPDDIFSGEEAFFNYDFWQSFGGTDGLDLGLSEIAMT